MIIKKRNIAAAAIAVMLAGSNSSVMACTDTTGKCSDVKAFTNSQMEKALAEMNKALAEMEKTLAGVKKVQVVAGNTKAEADAAQAQVEAAKAQADAAKAQAEAAKAQAEAAAAKEAAKPVTETGTTKPVTETGTTKPATETGATKPAFEIDAAKVAAEVAAAKAAAEAAKAQANSGTNVNVITTGTSTYVYNPDNGDEIATTFNPETKVTNISIKRPRKDAPDNFTQTSPSETAAVMIADGDIFNCDVGYYGNSISPVSLAPEYKSSLKIELKNSSEMTGEVNNNNKIQNVLLTMDKTSKWIVKGTSYLSALENEDKTLSNIVDNGNTIYYDSSIDSNSWLGGKTYKLGGGGELTPKK